MSVLLICMSDLFIVKIGADTARIGRKELDAACRYMLAVGNVEVC